MTNTIRGFLILLLLLPAVLRADNYPVGARQSAMGGTGVATTDLWGMYHNQAAIAGLSQTAVSFHYRNLYLVEQLNVASFALVHPGKAGAFGLTATHMGYSGYSETKTGFAYAKQLGKRLSAGIQLDYLWVNLSQSYGTRGTALGEIGLLYAPIDHLSIGAHVFNVSRSELPYNGSSPLPTIFRLGASYVLADKALLSVETLKGTDREAEYMAGVELWLNPKIAVRGGVSTAISAYSFGCGYIANNLSINIAFTRHPVLSYTSHLTLSYTFGSKAAEE